MDEITDLLSEKRLAKYKGIGKENAIACHLFNCELAESFYSSLSYFEIILRNKIDKVFSKYLGDDWIFKDEYIIGRNQDNMKNALAHIKDTKKNPTDKNHIISELNLGFGCIYFCQHTMMLYGKSIRRYCKRFLMVVKILVCYQEFLIN